jgi:hypothetical protein
MTGQYMPGKSGFLGLVDPLAPLELLERYELILSIILLFGNQGNVSLKSASSA